MEDFSNKWRNIRDYESVSPNRHSDRSGGIRMEIKPLIIKEFFAGSDLQSVPPNPNRVLPTSKEQRTIL
jgi:hypothetical protein